VTYLSPLAYLLGIQGVAILRGIREGFADEAFVQARIDEIRALIETPALVRAPVVTAGPGAISSSEVYRDWAPTYDEPGNGMIDIEEPVVRHILDGLPVGAALDAACGTGRHAAYLAQHGHRVIGVDQSAEMLEHAARRLPEADLRQGDLQLLPVADDAVDTIVCGLALAHVPDLAPVLAEFARVLRPGGPLVVSAAHLLLSYLRPTMPRAPRPDGRPRLLTEHHRPLSAYLSPRFRWVSRSAGATSWPATVQCRRPGPGTGGDVLGPAGLVSRSGRRRPRRFAGRGGLAPPTRPLSRALRAWRAWSARRRRRGGPDR
jgi:SAM-dependent methyltransferase